MKQRNDTGYTQVFPTLGIEVHPGDLIDHDTPLGGFTPVETKPAKAGKTKTPDAAPAKDTTPAAAADPITED